MKGPLVWLTGLPAAGKSTLAETVRTRLARRQIPVCLLDGDHIRSSIVPKLGHDAEARDQLYATLASLSALLCEQGLTVLVAATTHRREYRQRARDRVERFVEVYVHAAACPGRNADSPDLKAEMQEPRNPDVIAMGGRDEAAADAIVHAVETHVAKTARPLPTPGPERTDELLRLQRAVEHATMSFEKLVSTSGPSRAMDFIGVFLRAAASSLHLYAGIRGNR